MTQTNLEEMIAQMEQAVEEGLAYLEDAAGGTSPQVDRWTAKEVLAHMVYWHRASLQGIESVSGGGSPFQVPASSDVINDEIVAESLRHFRFSNGGRAQRPPETAVCCGPACAQP